MENKIEDNGALYCLGLEFYRVTSLLADTKSISLAQASEFIKMAVVYEGNQTLRDIANEMDAGE